MCVSHKTNSLKNMKKKTEEMKHNWYINCIYENNAKEQYKRNGKA